MNKSRYFTIPTQINPLNPLDLLARELLLYKNQYL